MVLLLSYDLVGQERPSSYERVRQYIEQHAISLIRPLYSQWLIETNASPDAWVKALRENNLVDANDFLFINQVRPPYQGWLTNEHWAWLNARVG